MVALKLSKKKGFRLVVVPDSFASMISGRSISSTQFMVQAYLFKEQSVLPNQNQNNV
jgi:hypothetical protein